MSNLRTRSKRGFSILEAVLAISILTVGLLGGAALLSRLSGTTSQSRYLSTQSMLASEKLEDLARRPGVDPAIVASPATSLTTDSSQSVTVGAVTETVDYYDDVEISSANGGIAESIATKDASGNTVYIVTTHLPDGTATSTQVATPPTPGIDTLQFKRRWLIEQDAPVKGVRRITVVVTLPNKALNASPFQMTMVRP